MEFTSPQRARDTSVSRRFAVAHVENTWAGYMTEHLVQGCYEQPHVTTYVPRPSRTAGAIQSFNVFLCAVATCTFRPSPTSRLLDEAVAFEKLSEAVEGCLNVFFCYKGYSPSLTSRVSSLRRLPS